jgi:hypothetical protein
MLASVANPARQHVPFLVLGHAGWLSPWGVVTPYDQARRPAGTNKE